MKKACITAGGAVWTLTFVLNEDNTITVHNFDKEDNDGYMFKNQLGVVDYLKESVANPRDRIVEFISIDGTEYEVTNKQNVYSYKQPL